MYKHNWYTIHNGIGKECDKCGKYTNIETDKNHFKTLEKEDCPINYDEEN